MVMKQSIINYISGIATTTKIWAGAIAALIGLAGSVYGFSVWNYNRGVKATTEQSIDAQFKTEVLTAIKVMKDSVATFSPMLRTVINNQSEIAEKQEDVKGAVNGLRGVVLDHISKDKAMTIEQFKQYMEAAPEVKKNSMRGSTQ
jgi:hypothetical protein